MLTFFWIHLDSIIHEFATNLGEEKKIASLIFKL